MEHLQYPVGRFSWGKSYDFATIQAYIQTIEAFPEKLIKLASSLSDEQLAKQYRPEGWNIRQVVHHLADSHINAYTRLKLTLTEDKPVIKPYMENLWAELPDARLPLTPSLQMLEGTHLRWTTILKSLKETDFERVLIHPEYQKEIPLAELTAMYEWHCRHHFQHIVIALQS